MTGKRSSPLVPKLRFPEFVDGPPWECPPLKKLAKRITQRNTHGADLRALTNSAERGVVDQREYFNKDIATNTDNYYIVEPGDYVYNPRVSSAAPVGPISKNKVGTGVMSPLYMVFRFRSDANDFFAHYFRSSRWHGYLRRVSNSGARHDRMAITNDDLMRMLIPTPSSREQQKIADCLGSLDDLIAAEGRKLEALRQHKQGLMQQLFPQPGETAPRLRFPEFEDAGDWGSTNLNELCEVITKGSTPTSYGYEYVSSGVRFVKIESLVDGSVNLSKTAYITDECHEAFFRSQLKKDDILFSIAGGLGFIARVSREVLPANVNQALAIVRLKESQFCQFLVHFLSSSPIQSEILRIKAGAAQPNISLSQLGNFIVLLPPQPEQQRIATCLTCLDDLILAQSANLSALKQHKQGLLQQLFPSLEGR